MKILRNLLILLALANSVSLYSQENIKHQNQESSKGKVFGKLYFDYYTEVNGGSNASAFEVRRAYFGYKYHLSENLEAIVKLDIGNPAETYSKDHIKRYAYFKNAKLKYHTDKMILNLGITDVLMIPLPEKYWGHRYINKAYTDRFKFSPKSDIGANFTYVFNKIISMDIGVYNGEGYSKLQNDNTFRGGLGISLSPFKNFLFRTYLDFTQRDTSRTTAAFFAGYKLKDKGVFGVEYNYQKNNSFLKDHDVFGYSLYGTWNFTKKWQIFARFDEVNSNILSYSPVPWNLLNNGNATTAGLQFTVRKGLKTSLNYQNWIPEDKSLSDGHFVFFNIEVKF